VSETTANEKLGPGASGKGRQGAPVDLLYTETETELRSAVRDLLADRAG